MERWAKKFNSQSETKKAAVKQAQEELRALEQKEEELRKKIHLEKSITSNLAQIASNKVRQIYNILPNIRIPLIRNFRLLEVNLLSPLVGFAYSTQAKNLSVIRTSQGETSRVKQ